MNTCMPPREDACALSIMPPTAPAAPPGRMAPVMLISFLIVLLVRAARNAVVIAMPAEGPSTDGAPFAS
ncbi:Uncharacterised protein [uncultured archaeon]|nr:Uncharacterised protein [uncultured archaeon]